MRAWELRVPPVALVLIAALGMWAAARALPGWVLADFPGRALLSVALFVVGLGVALAGVMAFRRARTTVNPTRPEASSAVVTQGIYRVSRNPMYLGMLLVLAAWAVWLAHPVAALFLPVFVAWMNRFQIAPEERALAARFWGDYEAYRRSVRRWV